MKTVNPPLSSCVFFRAGADYENKVARPSVFGCKLPVCQNSRGNRNRHRLSSVRLRILSTAAPTAAGGRLRSGLSRARVHLGSRLLVSCRTALLLARGVLVATALRPRILGRAALLRAPLLSRTLAPPVSRTIIAGVSPILRIALVTVLLSPAPLCAVDTERDFSGPWILDLQASDLRALPAPPEHSLTIAQDDVTIRCSGTGSDGVTSRWSFSTDVAERKY